MNARRWLWVALAGVIVLLGVLYVSMNPENSTLDAAVRSAAGGQDVALSDGVTHYELTGPADGTPVVLVHGFSVPMYIWDSTAVALSRAGYRVLRYDLFGRGLSDRPDITYDANLVDRQLGELLDSLRIGAPVHLMGLSFGGIVTATFSGRHPERVRSLTLIDPAAADRSPLPWYIRLPVAGPMLWQVMVVPGMADGQLGDFVEPARWPDWVGRYRTQMQYHGFGRALRSTLMWWTGVSPDSVYATAAGHRFPVQLIWGMEDQTVPIALSDRVRKAIPGIRYHPIERAGHLPHMERTDLVNPILLDFLRSVDTAGTGG